MLKYSAFLAVLAEVDGLLCIIVVLNNLGKWMVPGGHIEHGESPEEAAIRELQEESGIKMSPGTPLQGLESKYHNISLFTNVRPIRCTSQQLGAWFHQRITAEETKAIGMIPLKCDLNRLTVKEISRSRTLGSGWINPNSFRNKNIFSLQTAIKFHLQNRTPTAAPRQSSGSKYHISLVNEELGIYSISLIAPRQRDPQRSLRYISGQAAAGSNGKHWSIHQKSKIEDISQSGAFVLNFKDKSRTLGRIIDCLSSQETMKHTDLSKRFKCSPVELFLAGHKLLIQKTGTSRSLRLETEESNLEKSIELLCKLALFFVRN